MAIATNSQTISNTWMDQRRLHTNGTEVEFRARAPQLQRDRRFQSRSKEEMEEKRFEQNSHSESVVIHCPFLTWSSLLGLPSRFGSSSGLCRRTESLDGFFTTMRSFREVDASESGECTDEALEQLPPSHLKLISLDVELESSVSAFSATLCRKYNACISSIRIR